MTETRLTGRDTARREATPAGSGATPLAPGLPAVLRPDPALLRYYVLSSLMAGPFFVFPLVPLYFRYRSLRYEVDDEGITMRWGILFRREVSLTYARIQDIQLTSNFVERWLRLARIQVQTASGSASAEMTIEGVPAFEAVRDFLYSRMRGAKGDADRGAGGAVVGTGTKAVPAAAAGPPSAHAGELADTLREIAAELRTLRGELADGRQIGLRRD
ncbi:MAG TPA: PH domain-containing protein [Longimicrobiales bacterium]|nr:PH domain-containing protein [Longimicrobiales bacterium]